MDGTAGRGMAVVRGRGNIILKKPHNKHINRPRHSTLHHHRIYLSLTTHAGRNLKPRRKKKN